MDDDSLTNRVTNLTPVQHAIQDQYIHPTGTIVEIPIEEVETSIPARFEKIVRMYPDRLAVKHGDRSLTYTQLNQAANRIGHAILAERGLGNEPIALLFECGIDVITAILGVLKAGKFYVALDTSFPQERMNYMLEDSGAGTIVTNSRNLEHARNLANGAHTALNIDEIDNSLSPDNLGLLQSPDDLAMITYTSGSTGTPKGMGREQLMFLKRTKIKTREIPIHVTDRLSLIHSVVFGSANNCLFQSLLNGASLFPFSVKSEGIDRLTRWLHEEQITIFHSPPAVFRQLCELLSDQGRLLNLRLIRLSGASITQRDFELYKSSFSPRTFLEIHMGSTEAGAIGRAVVNHTFSYPEEGVPVGYAAKGKKILLLDNDGHEVKLGEVGEIAVKSRLLHPGYWKKPELTSAKFVSDPSGGDERIYLTGDLGRMLPDGFLIHLGRKDFMVKIRGYRVELAEIERALLEHPEVKETGIAAWDREPGEKYLVAYIVARKTSRPTVDELRGFLREKLPSYMIPSAFMFLDSLPLLNGKLDRQALPKPGNSRPALNQAYESPQNEVERQLVLIWEEVLGVKPVGIHDNFFDLGGHSLAASRIISRILKTFELDLPIKALFDSPTVTDMAVVITQNRAKKASQEDLARLLSEVEALSDEEAQRLLAKEAKAQGA